MASRRITTEVIALSFSNNFITQNYLYRSCTFQLMKLAFDEEVTAEHIDNLRKLLHKTRHPPNFWHYFAFAGKYHFFVLSPPDSKFGFV